jgi:hypothetical protein
MPESADEPVRDRVRAVEPALRGLLAEAAETWADRGRRAESMTTSSSKPAAPGPPGWHPFEDAFPTFYQFTNRPR